MEEKNIQRLLDDSKSYLQTQCDLMQLKFSAKLAQVVGRLILAFIAALLAVVTLVFGSLALVHWLTEYMPAAWGYLIVTGLYLVLIVVLFIFRGPLFINPLIGMVAGILLDKEVSADNLTHEAERLEAEAARYKESAEGDVQRIREDATRPTTIVNTVKRLPAIISVITTVWSVIRKLRRR